MTDGLNDWASSTLYLKKVNKPETAVIEFFLRKFKLRFLTITKITFTLTQKTFTKNVYF